jgi:hypothetical protein
MKTMKGIFCVLASALSLMLVHTARAEIRAGNFTFLPELGIYETYRSNVFLTQHNPTSDFITTIAPGAGMRYTFGQSSFSANYKVGFLEYAKYPGNNYTDQRANALLNWRLPGGLHFNFGDDFVYSWLEKTGVITRQRGFHQNFGKASVDYSFADRWKIEAKYNRDDLAFNSLFDRYAEYANNLLGASLYYRFLPRVSGLVEYDYAAKDFVTNKVADHKDQYVYGGIAFDPAGNIKGSIKGGFGWKQFDTNIQGRDNSPRNWVMAIQVVDNFSPKTSLTLDASRMFADDFDLSNASYVNTMASLTLQQYFTAKIGALASVTYRNGNYLEFFPDPVTGQEKKRYDQTWTFGAAAFYNVQKWFQLRLEYQYIERNSNFNLYSFIDNRIIFRIVLAL